MVKKYSAFSLLDTYVIIKKKKIKKFFRNGNNKPYICICKHDKEKMREFEVKITVVYV